jgi:hypothetical protein
VKRSTFVSNFCDIGAAYVRPAKRGWNAIRFKGQPSNVSRSLQPVVAAQCRRQDRGYKFRATSRYLRAKAICSRQASLFCRAGRPVLPPALRAAEVAV